ncbi:stage II sporulation protein P [Halobacillus locisalis]|uniref:Stage II sporulation protein P n=1 Tax=Halobacillus locisalis TaxID=220753 RepID=A0A838CN92_9BACI|nr:stage II sporulation protein P [Halobacillus locisalis]MBA2173537.1 stage II sporulation protein P [Halobacillus locisalis]
MRRFHKWGRKPRHPFKAGTKWLGVAVAVLVLLFIGIGVLTGAKSTYRLYSETIQNVTTKLEGSSFIYLFEMENRAFKGAHPEGERLPTFSTLTFQLLTSLTPNDPRSLLGREIPGLSSYNSQIIIAGKGTDYTTIPIESEPPLDVAERGNTGNIEEETPDSSENPETLGEDQVYIYHTHNEESFYPHLPDESTAYDGKVNITLVGERLGEKLEQRGIGAKVEQTNFMDILRDKGWKHYQSYDVARPVVEEAIGQNESLRYYFDLHRDSIAKEHTTTTINGKEYGRFAFVIGAEHSNYEENLSFATEMHQRLEDAYPGISRGVITKKGSGVDGVYNQDLNPNAILIEFGGVYNHLDELYRSADVLAEVFADYMHDAEKVSGD